jgi:diaminopimelate epimerase
VRRRAQVIFALPPVGDTDLAMRIYNSDGSEPEMCGNGIRCLARFVADIDQAQPRKYRIHTLAGARRPSWSRRRTPPARGPWLWPLAAPGLLITPRWPRRRRRFARAGLIQPELLPNGQVCVDMGEPILEGLRVPTTLAPTQGSTVVAQDLTVDGRTYKMTCVSMGNPHAVTFTVDGKPIKVRRWAPPQAAAPGTHWHAGSGVSCSRCAGCTLQAWPGWVMTHPTDSSSALRDL